MGVCSEDEYRHFEYFVADLECGRFALRIYLSIVKKLKLF